MSAKGYVLQTRVSGIMLEVPESFAATTVTHNFLVLPFDLSHVDTIFSHTSLAGTRTS